MYKVIAVSLLCALIVPTTLSPTMIQGPPIPPSPGDGDEQIAFTSDQDGDYEVYLIGADGTNLRQVTNNDDVDWYPAWSPDGTMLTFGASRDGGSYEVYIINVNGSNEQMLTDNDASDLDPAWTAEDSGSDGIPAAPGSGIVAGYIAFVSDQDGDLKIYHMNSDGSDIQPLTTNDTQEKDPEWSSDGTSLFFAGEDDAGDFELYVMAIDDSDRTIRQLTDNDAQDEAPAISPNGRYLAFVSDRDGNYEIYILDIYTEAVSRLTNDAGYDISPDWSPDGERIVFVSDRDGDYEIYIMDADGANIEQLTNNTVNDLGPAWSPSVAEEEPVVPIVITVEPVDTTSDVCRVVNDEPGDANVRGGPGTNYAIVGQFTPGSSAQITGQNDRWYRINYGGIEAWIANWVIGIEGDCSSLVFAAAPPTPTPPPTPPPDTVIIEFWADDTEIGEGDCTILHWETENIREVYVEGTGVGGNDSWDICPDSTYTYTLEVILRDGTTETRTVTITIIVAIPPTTVPQPDLYVSEFSLNPSTPTQGQPVDVRVGVYNQGNASVVGTSFHIEWWAGENFPTPGCTWDLTDLSAGGGRILTCTYAGYTSWYGSINTKVVVDTANSISESDETNNVLIQGISVIED